MDEPLDLAVAKYIDQSPPGFARLDTVAFTSIERESIGLVVEDTPDRSPPPTGIGALRLIWPLTSSDISGIRTDGEGRGPAPVGCALMDMREQERRSKIKEYPFDIYLACDVDNVQRDLRKSLVSAEFREAKIDAAVALINGLGAPHVYVVVEYWDGDGLSCMAVLMFAPDGTYDVRTPKSWSDC